jgi:starch synthase
MQILFVTAENGALKGGKVGGIGDVIRHLPPALAEHNCRVSVVCPSHGFLHQIRGSTKIHEVNFLFRGYPHTADIYEVPAESMHPDVTHWVIHHPLLSSFDSFTGKFRIYTHDPADRPFFTDATRFAFFDKAVAAAVSDKFLGKIDCIHLHDWHAAFISLLREFHPDYAELKMIRTVYSIHNLVLQGVRPLRGNESSLEAWFPELHYNWSDVADPRWPDCFNAMAIGIRLSDVVHTVSPSYAEEIQKPSQKPQFYGGEGLETDLIRANQDGRLIGILNGCDYPTGRKIKRYQLADLLDLFRSQSIRWTGVWDTVPTSQFITYVRALEFGKRFSSSPMLLTSVSRVVDQKVLLLRESGTDGKSGLQGVLEGLGENACYILLGNGDWQYEKFLIDMSSRHDNFLFMNGYSEKCAKALYASGDLFLMPSSFEPCGLSQMLAMRDGQPCVVHEIGGLKDTVQDGNNGFTFKADSLSSQVDKFVQTSLAAIALKKGNPAKWKKICKKAGDTRFRWSDSAHQYLQKLYEVAPG